MALPSNKIRKIQTPDSIEYDIIPSILQDGTTSYKLSVPTLSVDSTIALTSDIAGKANDSDVVHKGTSSSSVAETIYGSKTFNDITYFNNHIYGNSNLYLTSGSSSYNSTLYLHGSNTVNNNYVSITTDHINLNGDVNAKFLSLNNNGTNPSGIEIYGGYSALTPFIDWHRSYDSKDDYDLRLIMDNTRTLSLISRQLSSGSSVNYYPTFRIGEIAMNGNGRNELNLKVGAGSTIYIGYRNPSYISGNAIDAYVFGASTASSSGRGDVYANIHNDSDRRLKENFTDSSITNYTKLIEDIPLVDYNYIGNDTPQLGIIAQDLEEILPERYKKEFIGKHKLREKNGDNTEYLSIVESKLIYLCIGAIKELASEIKELKKKL